jgi:hypothetical protein
MGKVLMKLPDRVYHLAEAANWPSIQRHGLLSAGRLIQTSELAEADRVRLERGQRLTHTELSSGVQIRDQRPMPPAALERCLCGMSPADWYATINARVFFWVDVERLNRQRAACEPRPQVVMAVDTAALVAAYDERVAVIPINTGNARRKPARRGAATFVPLAEWVKSGWTSEAAALGIPSRRASHQPAELTVIDAVPDILHFVVGTFALPSGQSFEEKSRASKIDIGESIRSARALNTVQPIEEPDTHRDGQVKNHLP